MTPTNPTPTAAHLRGPTASFKNITENTVISNGLIKKIATPSASGNAANPKKNVIFAKTTQKPLRKWRPSRLV